MRTITFIILIASSLLSFSQQSYLDSIGANKTGLSSKQAEGLIEQILKYNKEVGFLHAKDCEVNCKRIFELADKFDLRDKKTEGQLSLARLMIFQSNIDSAGAIVTELYEHKLDQNKLNQIKITQLYGSIQVYKKLYDDALKYYLEALDMCGKDYLFEKTSLYANLGHLFYSVQDQDKSMEYLKKGEGLALELKDSVSLVSIYNLYGIWEKRNGNYEKSIEYLIKALRMAEDHKLMNRVNHISTNLSNSYFSLGRDEIAMKYFKKSFEISIQSSNIRSRSIAYHSAAYNYYSIGKLDSSLYMANKSLKEALKINDAQMLMETNAILYNINVEMEKYYEALSYLSIAYDYKDSFYMEAQSRNVLELEGKYNQEKIELKYKLEKQRDEQLQIEKLRSREVLLWIAAFIILLVIVGLFMVFKKNKVIKSKNEEIKVAYDEIEVRNNEIMDSINYAKQIQNAILPSDHLIKSKIPDSFILYQPKDVVAGDFYWISELKENKNITFLAVADCTGHGVPGAMVSVVCNNNLNRSVKEFGLSDPGEILDKTRELVIEEFEKAESEVKDGMDISLISIERMNDKMKVSFAGAYNPLWVLRKNEEEIEEFKGDKQPIGKFSVPKPFKTSHLELNKGDVMYLFTDGFADQFGGPKGKKMKSKAFKTMLVSLKNESMATQKNQLISEFEKWRGELEQVDDVCIAGIKC